MDLFHKKTHPSSVTNSYSSHGRFCLHARRVLASGPVPYVATLVWNDSLRQELGQEVPRWGRRLDTRAVVSAREKVKELLKDEDVEEAEEDDDEMVVLPEFIGRTLPDISHYIKMRLVQKEGKVVRVLLNIEGRVESVLSPHLALLSFKGQDRRSRRVICISEEVFSLEPGTKIDTVKALLAKSAKNTGRSLSQLMKEGQRVTLNALPLVSSAPNDAEVYYTACGVLLAPAPGALCPLACLPSSALLSQEHRLHHMKVLRQLDKRGRLGEGCSLPPSLPPSKFLGVKGLKVVKEWRVEEQGEVRKVKLVDGEVRKVKLVEEIQEVKKVKDNKRKVEEVRETKRVVKKVKRSVLPAPVSSLPQPVKPVVWEQLLQEQYGQVLKIVDKNYGLAVGFVQSSPGCYHPFQLLFDTFDLYLGDKNCAELGKKLGDVMEVGDFVKFNIAKVEREGEEKRVREIAYMATAMVMSKTSEDIRTTAIPGTAAVVTSLDQVAKEKLANFRTVVNYLGVKGLSAREEELVEGVRAGRLARQVLEATRGLEDNVVEESEEEEEDVMDNLEVVEEEQSDDDDEIMIVEERKIGFTEEKEKPAPEARSWYEAKSDATKKKAEAKAIVKPAEKPKQQTDALPSASEQDLAEITSTYSPSELRRLVMAYISQVSGRQQGTKLDLAVLRQEARSSKEGLEVARLLLAVTRRCQEVQARGCKVGHVFLTQGQVVILKEKGVKRMNEIKMGEKLQEEADVTEKFSSAQLRKFLLSFMKLLDKKCNLAQLAKENELNVPEMKEVLQAVVTKCQAAPVVEGVRTGFKLQNVFVNSTLAGKIAAHGKASIQ